MLNWNEIRKRYPKADKLWTESEYSHWRNFAKQTNNEVLKNRNLYDFFDHLKIYISIQSRLKEGKRKFEVSIYKKYREIFSTRIGAEEAAFIKAFEVLERRFK